jgi:hypothetical protein
MNRERLLDQPRETAASAQRAAGCRRRRLTSPDRRSISFDAAALKVPMGRLAERGHEREAGPSRSTMARLVHTPMLK